MKSVEAWNNLPRVIRGGLVAAIGGATTLAVVAGNTGESHNEAPNYATFAVGISCDEPPSNVLVVEGNNNFRFRCLDKDGDSGVVTGLAQLMRNHSAHPRGYDAVVDVTAKTGFSESDVVVEFSFTGDDAIATIGTAFEVSPMHSDSRLHVISRGAIKNNTIYSIGTNAG